MLRSHLSSLCWPTGSVRHAWPLLLAGPSSSLCRHFPVFLKRPLCLPPAPAQSSDSQILQTLPGDLTLALAFAFANCPYADDLAFVTWALTVWSFRLICSSGWRAGISPPNNAHTKHSTCLLPGNQPGPFPPPSFPESTGRPVSCTVQQTLPAPRQPFCLSLQLLVRVCSACSAPCSKAAAWKTWVLRVVALPSTPSSYLSTPGFHCLCCANGVATDSYFCDSLGCTDTRYYAGCVLSGFVSSIVVDLVGVCWVHGEM